MPQRCRKRHTTLVMLRDGCEFRLWPHFMNKIPRRILKQMANKAIMDSVFSGRIGRKVGRYLEQLLPEERAAIQNLKSDEISQDFIPQ